ncbi:MAG: DUF3422 domain-containing protein [Burkholderiaceae bacterium]|nr:DUF3422 domain-containing protein [Burkholderiaceae bacterium]
MQNEIHARPRQLVTTPQRVSHIALLRSPGGEHSREDPLAVLCGRAGIAAPGPRDDHFLADFGDYRLKRERHGEFDGYTVYRDGCDAREPFAQRAIDALPPSWLETLPGSLIAAVHIAILRGAGAGHQAGDTSADDERRLAGAGLRDRELCGCAIGDGLARAFTDFHLAPDGFTRIVVVNDALSPAHTGRQVQRLIEIEVYRMMAMLAFPLARSSAVELDAIEASLGALVARMESAPVTQEPALLREITRLAATAERIDAATGFRFGAARAYHSLVRQRGVELREQRLPGMQTLTAFLERRFDPAMAFCDSVGRRSAKIAERIARASALLRTRVEIERERHNQQLLAAMNRRARLQLNLQQTVEGLSVAAITYYVTGLAGYGFKAVKAAGWHIDTDLATGLSVLPIAIVVALAVRHIREGVKRRLGVRETGAAGEAD